MFCEFCKIFKSTFLIEHLWWLLIQVWKYEKSSAGFKLLTKIKWELVFLSFMLITAGIYSISYVKTLCCIYLFYGEFLAFFVSSKLLVFHFFQLKELYIYLQEEASGDIKHLIISFWIVEWWFPQDNCPLCQGNDTRKSLTQLMSVLHSNFTVDMSGNAKKSSVVFLNRPREIFFISYPLGYVECVREYIFFVSRKHKHKLIPTNLRFFPFKQ